MEENIIKRIEIKSCFNVAAANYSYESYNFVFDFENNISYFKKKELYEFRLNSILNKENKEIFWNIHNFYTTEVFKLNKMNLYELNSVIIDLKREYKKNPLLNCDLNPMIFYWITIEYSNQEKDYFKLYYDEIPSKLIEIFEKLVGFDVFNSENIKSLITEKDYVINENEIYDKETGNELTLKKIDYSKECGDFIRAPVTSFHLDFDKKELITYDDKKIMISDTEAENILSLIKKYGVFKWNSIEYSNKAINNPAMVFDGCSWRLSLVFDGGQVLNFGGDNNEHDTYYEFGEELLKMFRMDLLDIARVRIK